MRPESPAPSVLLFDFGGTLDSDGIPWKERFRCLFAEEGVNVAPEAFDAAFHAADDALVGKIPRRFCLEETIKELSGAIARNLRLDDPAPARRVAARFVADSLSYLSKNSVLLSRLRERYALGVVSNFYGNLAAVCEGAGLAPHLGVMVDSAAVGFEKPDRRIFLAALEGLDAEPAEAVFVGDSMPRDMAGARDVGMPHIWLAAGQGATCCPGDRVIRRLSELSEMFL
jgi:FMN phosphatase YigB (HAD superfamily)